MARDVFSASVFGAGMVWDAFIIAWTIPNLFRRLFGEGALASTFIPVYSEAVESGPPHRPSRVLRGTLGSLLILLGALVAMGVGFCLLLPLVLKGWVGPEGGEKLELASHLTALLIPYLLFICVAALFSAVLNVHRRFAAAAAGPALLNVFWLAGLAVALLGFRHQPQTQIFIVSVSLLGGGLAQSLLLIPQIVQFVGIPKPRLGFRDPDVRHIGTLALPVLFGLAILQVNVLFDRFIAEFCVPGDGAVSALYYGNRLVQFPLGVIGVAVSTAAFPLLSRLAARGELERMKRVLGGALKGSLFLALPAAAGLIILATPIVDLLFGHGAFADDPDATHRTGLVLALYALGLPAYILLPAAARGFYALQDMRTPTRIALLTLLVNLSLNLTLVWILREGGLALATSLSAALNLSILLLLLRKRIGLRLRPGLLFPAWKGIVSTAVMAACCLGLWSYLPILQGEGLSARFARLAVVIGMGATVFFLLSVLLRDDNLAILRRRGKPLTGEETP
jgi:putative peptidoglycan lipid II flippase